MIDEIDDVDGVKATLGLDAIVGPAIPRDVIPDSIRGELENENYELLLITSEYKVASDEVNAQCDAISGIIKSYDENGMLIGEAPCTQDLITTTDHDFKVVSAVSIGAIRNHRLQVIQHDPLRVLRDDDERFTATGGIRLQWYMRQQGSEKDEHLPLKARRTHCHL